MTKLYGKTIPIIALFFLALFGSNSVIFAAGGKNENEKFKPETFIFDHIVDSYGWHITTFKGHHIGIPLPVILIDDGEFVCFSSSRLHSGTAAYKGYMISDSGPRKGKIVKLKDSDFTGHIESGEIYEINEDANLWDFSITKNVCSLFISIILICVLFISVAKAYKKREGKAPKGLQTAMEILILFIRDDVAKPSLGKNYLKYFPYLLTLFFFIFINNLMGLIPIFPGGANLTGNIAVTGTLALITLLIILFSSKKVYWAHIFNTPGVPWWLKIPIPLMPAVEFISVFTKPFVLMVRLFANITAGHIIVLGFIGLIFIFGEMSPALGAVTSVFSVFFYLFMCLLELVVAFVQAFLFTLLTAIFVGMAAEDSHEAEHEHQNINKSPH